MGTLTVTETVDDKTSHTEIPQVKNFWRDAKNSYIRKEENLFDPFKTSINTRTLAKFKTCCVCRVQGGHRKTSRQQVKESKSQRIQPNPHPVKSTSNSSL